MQNMQKEVEAEGAKEKELGEKFMCYCKGGTASLDKAIADADAAIDEATAKLKAEEAEKSQIAQELIDHKKDREQAKADIEEASVLRSKEEAEFTASKADSDTNIAAMAKAIPAIEKGMGGAALLQLPIGNRLRNLVDSFPSLDPMDRRNLHSFLETGDSDSSQGAGEILGILKAMKDEMEADLKEAIADEQKAVAGFTDLKTSKETEIETATESIETKMGRAGELAVSVVQTKDALEDSTEEKADTEKFKATLEKDCKTKEAEMAERAKMRSQEVAAISEAISILNDDDALDVFKKAPAMSLSQTPALGFLQRSDGHADRAHRAQAILARTAVNAHDAHVNLILYTLGSKLKLKSKGGFDEVIKMIDDMVVLLGKQQKEDEKQKEYCEGEFEKAEDEEKATTTKLEQVDAALAEATDAIVTLAEQIKALGVSINDLDQEVAAATEQRKEEHALYVETMQMNEAAVGLVGKAKNRMQKFYNPTLYKAPEAFAQVHTDEFVAPPPAPEMPSGPVKKNEKSAGVIGMMDTIIKDLENGMKDAEYEEKTAQNDYADLMADSQATRQGDTKALTSKEATKAETEAQLMADKEKRAATATDLKNVKTVIQDLHAACDFIMKNFDLRKEARTNEIEGLKNAKAVLSGASFSF